MDQPYWMVKTVLYLGLIKMDENLVDMGCFPLLYVTSSPMDVRTVLHTMLKGGRLTKTMASLLD